MSLLPDDIEQFLITGQRLRATYALMAQRGISFDEARVEIGRRLQDNDEQDPMPPAG